MTSTKKTPETPLLSLILNVYNEEKNVKRVFYEVKKVLDKSKTSYELIFSESGSVDKSFEIIKKIEKEYPRIVRALKVKENSPGAKLIAAFGISKGKYIGFLCSDGQDDPSIIPKAIKLLQEGKADFVKGRRINRENFKRVFVSRCYNLFAFLLFGTQSSDINGHPKIFSRKVLNQFQLISRHESIDLEIFVKAKLLGLKIIEIPVIERIREGGGSSVGISVTLKFIKDMLSYKFGIKAKSLNKFKINN